MISVISGTRFITIIRGLLKTKHFQNIHGYETCPTEQSVKHFILYLEKNAVTKLYINKVKPAINLLENLVNLGKTVFTKGVCRILGRVKNLTLERKTQVVNAPRLALETIKKMVNKVVIPCVQCPDKVNAINLRTVFRIVY